MTQTSSRHLCNSDPQPCAKAQARASGFDAYGGPPIAPPEGLELSLVAMAVVRPAAVAIHHRLTRLAAEGILGRSAVDAVFDDLVDPLWHALFGIVSRSMVVELAAARSTGLLQGETEAERYRFFVDCLADEEFALSILEECPPLHLLVETFTQNWRNAVGEMLRYLAEDLARIESHFFPENAPGAIVRISLSHGDRHRHGRSVAILEFASGHKLVYKPRSLAAEIGFADFACWFNTRTRERLLASVKALDCGDHGWSAFVDPQPIATNEDLDNYYFRLGTLLAVARVLGLSDLHAENLIAAGAWPTIIDLETLFHPPAGRFKSNASPPPATERLFDCLDRSVLASGLLPVRARQTDADTIDLDLAGMSDSAGQTIPFETPHWEKSGTDEMAIGFARQTLAGNANLPVLNGKRMAPEPFAGHVLSGFRHAYRTLQDNRKALLAEDGPLSAFKGAAVRVVVRPTAFYAALLQDGTHPTILQSATYKSSWLREQLKGPDASRCLDGLAASELSALLRQDIPYFETVPDSRGVSACDGMTRPHVLSESGLDASRKIIATLGAPDLSLQVWLISLCLTKAGSTKTDFPTILKKPELSSGRLTDLAHDVAHLAARQVTASAIPCKGNATWTTAQEGQRGTLVCGPAGLDLYSGLPGIALFMSYAGAVLECRDYCECGRAAWREVLDTLRQDAGLKLETGAYSGLGGLVYALVKAQLFHPDLPMTAAARDLLGRLDLTAPETLPLEMIDGLAGLISCLSAISPASSVGTVEETLMDACRAVAAKLGALENGDTSDPILDQAGAAHGMAGLSAALARLHQHDSPSLSDMAGNALSRLDRLRAKSVDIEPNEVAAHRIAWCNGQAGLLAGASLHEPADSHLIRSIVARLRAQDYQDDSLCHGSAGAVLALNAAKPFCSERHRGAIERASTMVLGRILERGPQCGTINRVPTPGLMDGLAGIGFAALSLVDPGAVPSLPGLAMSGPQATDTPKRQHGRF